MSFNYLSQESPLRNKFKLCFLEHVEAASADQERVESVIVYAKRALDDMEASESAEFMERVGGLTQLIQGLTQQIQDQNQGQNQQIQGIQELIQDQNQQIQSWLMMLLA